MESGVFMVFIDWVIVVALLVFIAIMALTTRKYNRSVADFLSANRCAGRYLLCIAQHEAAIGAIYVISYFTIFYKTGWTLRYWRAINIPILLFMALSGFFFYRYRQTRSLTMAQFLEKRYSRKFRVFSGIICWLSGLLNFGVFPAIGAEFFINFCRLPAELNVAGLILPTFPLVVGALVLTALFFTFISGQIGILVTDFWQGLFTTVAFIVIIIFLWIKFPWPQISDALIFGSKPGDSLVDPFKMGDRPEFGFVYYLIMIWLNFYYTGAWQGSQGYQTSAVTPHEAKMAPIVGSFRQALVALGLMLVPLAVLAVMNLPEYSDTASEIKDTLLRAYPGDDNSHLRERMLVPTTLTHILPPGLVGAFTAVMLGFFISTNNSYMHSWGTILIQDVISPLKKKTFDPKKHILLLKISIGFVALFGFFFSLFFKLEDYIQMYFNITGAVYLGGAGAVILGGLYWKRGSVNAAWSTMITGSVLSIVFILFQKSEFIMSWFDSHLPIWTWNGTKFSFVAGLISVSVYVLVSLFGPKHVANMDKLLHRGKYTVEDEEKELKKRAENKPLKWYWKMIGVKSTEFSFFDRMLFAYTFIMRMIWEFGGFLVVLALVAFGFMTESRWNIWWHINLYVTVVLACIGATWITVGGLYDLKMLYYRLSRIDRNEYDDGRVAGEQNLADEEKVDE
jgi:solute:Na+ symporter, SSS family